MNLKQKLSKKLKKTGGFTLIEMLIVVAIIAILVAVSIPMVTGSLDKARQATDEANERAAKGAALSQYMLAGDSTTIGTYFDTTTGSGGTSDTLTCYYNAADGTVQKTTTNIEPYNQADQPVGSTTTVPRGKGCVKVTITVDTGETETVWEAVS